MGARASQIYIYISFWCHSGLSIQVSPRFITAEESTGKPKTEVNHDKFESKKEWIQKEVKRQFDGVEYSDDSDHNDEVHEPLDIDEPVALEDYV
jgi:hypothetical protein